MNFLINRIAFKVSEAAKKYTIVKNKYLVPVKPKRTLSAYILFTNQNRSKITGSATEIISQLGAQWKALPAEEKKKFQDQAQRMKEQNQKIVEQYESQYVEPFKTITNVNLITKKLYETAKNLKVTEAGKLIKQAIQGQSEYEKKKLQQQVERIKKQRSKISQQYLIPEAEYKTLRAFMRGNLKNKKASEITPKKREQLQQKYVTYQEQYKTKLEQFAKKFNLTRTDLEEIIKLNSRRLKREKVSDATASHLSAPEPIIKKKATKKTTKKAKTTKTAAKKTKAATKKTKAAKQPTPEVKQAQKVQTTTN